MPEISTLAHKHHSLKEGNFGDTRLMAHKISLIEPEMINSKIKTLSVQIHVVSLFCNISGTVLYDLAVLIHYCKQITFFAQPLKSLLSGR